MTFGTYPFSITNISCIYPKVHTWIFFQIDLPLNKFLKKGPPNGCHLLWVLVPTSCSHDCFFFFIIIYFEFCPLLPIILNIISHTLCGVLCRWWHSWNGGWLQLFIIACKDISWLFAVHGVFMVIFLFFSLESTSFTIAIMFNNYVAPSSFTLGIEWLCEP